MKLRSKHFRSIASEFARKLYPLFTEESKGYHFDERSGAMVEGFTMDSGWGDLYTEHVVPLLRDAWDAMTVSSKKRLSNEYCIELDQPIGDIMIELIDWHLQDIHLGHHYAKQDAEEAASYAKHTCDNCGNVTTEDVAECVDCKQDPEDKLAGDEDFNYPLYERRMQDITATDVLSDRMTVAAHVWAQLAYIYNESVLYAHSDGDTHYYIMPQGVHWLHVRIYEDRKQVRDSRRTTWRSTGSLQESIAFKRTFMQGGV